MDSILLFDEQIFRILNGLHAEFLDGIMVFATKTHTWFPLYALIIFFLFRTYRKDTFLVLFAVFLLILLADQFASGLMKPLFERLRPCHREDFQTWIFLPDGKAGGKFGFISSHAANTFALAAFLSLLLKNKMHASFRYLLWFWAFFVSYTRIYVGVHYPLDLIFGGGSGVMWARLIYFFLPEKYKI
jgi:undecaprenyl-diphosphatase